MIDDQNPAVSKHVQVPPALLEDVARDPAAAQPVFRAMALIQAHELFMQRANMSVSQQTQLIETFSKMGDMAPRKEVANGGNGAPGFSLVINLPSVDGAPGRTIDVKAVGAEPVESDE